MQKVLKRTAQAEKQALRRLKLDKIKQVREEDRTRTRHLNDLRKEIRGQRRDARTAWREDWEMGPLAPFRDSPRVATEANSFRYWGTLNGERIHPNLDRKPEYVDALCRWAGGSKHLCLAPKDRVVIMEGPLKGKIAAIQQVDADMGVLTLDGETLANVTVPDFAFVKTGGTNVMPTNAQIPISAVRLVHPIKNPKTGLTRDVVIKSLQPVNIVRNRHTREVDFDRVVPGLNVEIPWPPKAEPEYNDGAMDTLRIDVEQKTFVPTLLRAPMPETVIDELRGRYSRFRTRHTPEYMAKKEAEAAEKHARKTSLASMRTPLQELNLQQRAIRKARGQPVLTDEMLEKIGQVIARNKKNALEAAGATEVVVDSQTPEILETVVHPADTIPDSRPPTP